MKNEYYQKFTELKKREPKRIDLSIKDLQGYLKKVKQINKTVQKSVKVVLSMHEKTQAARAEVRKENFEAGNIYKQAETQFKKDIKAAKDLGVDSSEFSSLFKAIQGEVDGGNKAIENMLSRLKR